MIASSTSLIATSAKVRPTNSKRSSVRSTSPVVVHAQKSDDDAKKMSKNATNDVSVNRRNALLAMTVAGASAAKSAQALDLGSIAEDFLKEKDMSQNEDMNAIKAKRAVNLPKLEVEPLDRLE